jgi:hypothetical protein
MANDLTTPFQMAEDRRVRMAPGPGVEEPVAAQPLYSDEELLELWTDIKSESIDNRHVFEVQWRRNIYYILNRQWIEYITGRGWRDKRMAPWIPRPVTNKCKETVQAIRAMFTSIKLGVNARPNGADPQNVATAAVADELAPVLHETHSMNAALSEFDFWLVSTGNAFFHTFVDYDIKNGVIEIPHEECLTCGAVATSDQIAGAQPVCPECGSTAFGPALDEMGEPIVTRQPKGKPTTLVLSPLELAFPNSYARFDDLPYVVRLRWRTKRYFESNPALKKLVDAGKISWQKSPSDQNLSLFQSLSQHNDLGVSAGYMGEGTGSTNEDGISEYEVWMKPCEKYPQGLVFRIYGEQNPIVAHLEEQEALPGPLPYRDADGNPLFTFAHAGFEHVGGRVLASGPIDVIIQKQDQLNQLDSMILLIIQRMSNPVWLTPKGAEIQKFTGMPGLVLRWNPLTVGGNAKPERIAGEGPHPTLFQIREQYLKDIEELAGTFDIIKGAKPTGVEAFSAMQLLVERSQSRFSGVFQSRGDAYKSWFKFALELEREFGPEDRTKAVLTPARTWTFQTFKRAQLQGSVSVIVEDGSQTPKTNLGMRAAIEHANQLGMLNMQDPDQQYEGLKLFGLTRMVPTLDVHVQSALQKQQVFEEWVLKPENVQAFVMQAQEAQMAYQQQLGAAQDPAQPMPQPPSMLEGSPLKWKPWYNPVIHKQELMKWANSDRMRELFQAQPIAEKLVELHLNDINMALAQEVMQQMAMAGGQPGGAGAAMANSNRESTSGNEPKGNGEGAQNAGPR